MDKRRYPVGAMQAAIVLVDKLEPEGVFSFIVTNDDGTETRATLNVFAPESEWSYLRSLLNLSVVIEKSVDAEDASYMTYETQGLLVSLIDLNGGNDA